MPAYIPKLSSDRFTSDMAATALLDPILTPGSMVQPAPIIVCFSIITGAKLIFLKWFGTVGPVSVPPEKSSDAEKIFTWADKPTKSSSVIPPEQAK